MSQIEANYFTRKRQMYDNLSELYTAIAQHNNQCEINKRLAKILPVKKYDNQSKNKRH